MALLQRLATTSRVLSKTGRVETHLCWWTSEPWLLARSNRLRAKLRGRIQRLPSHGASTRSCSRRFWERSSATTGGLPWTVEDVEAVHVASMPCNSIWPLVVQAQGLVPLHDPFELSSNGLNMGAEGPRSRMLLAEPRHVKGVRWKSPIRSRSNSTWRSPPCWPGLLTQRTIANEDGSKGPCLGRRILLCSAVLKGDIHPAPVIVELTWACPPSKVMDPISGWSPQRLQKSNANPKRSPAMKVSR